MNILTHPRLLFLGNVGLVLMLLAGCAAPVATPVVKIKTGSTGSYICPACQRF